MSKIIKLYTFFLLLFPILGLSQTADLIVKGDEAFKAKEYGQAFEYYSKGLKVLPQDADPRDWIKLLESVSKSLTHQFKMQEGLAYLEKADSVAIVHNLDMAHVDLSTSKISLWNYLGMREKIYETATEMLARDDIELARRSEFHQSLAYYYEFSGDNDLAIENHRKAYSIDKELKDSSSFPFSALGYGLTLSRGADNDKALDVMLEGMSWLRGEIDRFKEATFYWRIQGVFLKQRNYEKAKEYGQKGIEIAEQENIVMTKARIELGMYQVYLYEGNLDNALEVLNNAIPVFVDKKATDRVHNGYVGKAEVFLAMNEIDSAEYYVNLAGQYQDDKIIFDNLNRRYVLASINMEKGDLTAAKNIFEECLQIVSKYSRPYWEKDIIEKLSQISYDLNNTKEAYNYLRRFESLKDSIYFLEQDRTINELEKKYQTAEQKQEIAELNIINERRKSINKLIVSALVFSLVILGFILWLFRINRRNKKILEEKNDVIEKALDEKELLLREIHHRVKNNLQVISSLLNLQTKFVDDDSALEALNEGKNRVKSMALIHQNLYQEDNLTGIEIKAYFDDLCRTLFDSYNISDDEVQLELDIEEINLDVDTVIPIGLIMNELISNALKYAFVGGQQGKIRISLKERDNQVLLSVNDNGRGIKEEDLSQKRSFGYKLIKAFLKKLDATIQFENSKGTKVLLTIKKYKKVA